MLEELKEEEIVNKVGGRFKLSTLIQKRLVQLNQGSRALVDMGATDKMKVVLQEILQNKIYLDTSNEVRITGETQETGEEPEFDFGDLMNDREVLVGVTGGIAAYKTAALVSRLAQAGAGVSVVMTHAATELIGAATFASLTGRPVRTGVFDEGGYPKGTHIALAEQAELLCVAPATANFLAKAAHGIADDLLSTVYLAFSGPVVVVPAMNTVMWEQPAVQRNVQQLVADGVHLVGPEDGWLACRTVGAGRMSDPETILAAIEQHLPPQPSSNPTI